MAAAASTAPAAFASVVGTAAIAEKRGSVKRVEPDSFEAEDHFYPRVLNATIHPLVASLFSLSTKRIVTRYCHMHPTVDADTLTELLEYNPQHFRWVGCDTFNVTSTAGKRQVVVIETNSCPSGQKSFPLLRDHEEQGGYRRLLQTTFADLLKRKAPKLPLDAAAGEAEAKAEPAPAAAGAGEGGEAAAAAAAIKADEDTLSGVLAVIYDKNLMEASGYAKALADLTTEPVYMAEFYLTDSDPPVRFDSEGVMHVRVARAEVHPSHTGMSCTKVPPHRHTAGAVERTPEAIAAAEAAEAPGPSAPMVWLPVRAAYRYVTQRPWTRLPVVTRTPILNPVVACLAGGRNKLVASKAYDLFNGEMSARGSSLRINTPRTINDVRKAEVPMWIKSLGGQGVIKVPYSNAGQGVYTILNPAELAAFMAEDFHYDKFIVQALIGNSSWGSTDSASGQRLYHVGTVPNRRNEIFVADVRMMISATDSGGWRPVAVYARRAHKPLIETLPTVGAAGMSWPMLGTNLSKLSSDLAWTTESERLMLMDRKDFNQLGIGLDDLLEAFVQTVMCAAAIDKMARRLMKDGKFNVELFASLNDDPALLEELV